MAPMEPETSITRTMSQGVRVRVGPGVLGGWILAMRPGWEVVGWRARETWEAPSSVTVEGEGVRVGVVGAEESLVEDPAGT